MKYSMKWIISQYEKGKKLKYIFFWGHKPTCDADDLGKFSLSQWYDSPFTVKKQVYPTAEHWMMAEKALLFKDYEMHQAILTAKSPGEVKELGRRVKGFDIKIWESKRFDIVKTGNKHKFSQNPDLLSYLLATKDRVLVEASPFDTIWGIGLRATYKHIENPTTWLGLNLLGFALMEVRDFLLKRTERSKSAIVKH